MEATLHARYPRQQLSRGPGTAWAAAVQMPEGPPWQTDDPPESK